MVEKGNLKLGNKVGSWTAEWPYILQTLSKPPFYTPNMVLSAPHKKHPPTQKKKHSHGILRRRHQSHQPPVRNREFGQNQKTLTSAVAVYPPWWVVDGSLPSLDGFWFQHVRERQGIITVTSLSLAPWSPFISPIVATGWNRQKQCESIGRVQRSWTTDAPFVCITYIYIYNPKITALETQT